MNSDVNSYSVIWRYKIREGEKKKFEQEYGKNGTWCQLFSKSNDCLGSLLYKSEDETNTYILIDTWTDRQSYENFLKINSEIYNNLSSNFEDIYESEERIGSFRSI